MGPKNRKTAEPQEKLGKNGKPKIQSLLLLQLVLQTEKPHRSLAKIANCRIFAKLKNRKKRMRNREKVKHRAEKGQ